MAGLSPVEQGKLLEAVNKLTDQVEDLNKRLQNMELQVARGRGLLFGIIFAAGGLSAGITNFLTKLGGN
mgnify:FL=1|jgi:acetylornithine/succinyldiaminopimelate/putrescine aminotransferase|tara:strand:- start:408 stop:614 length:207 start_codon:yes stop_codon:yes gene_type:complete